MEEEKKIVLISSIGTILMSLIIGGIIYLCFHYAAIAFATVAFSFVGIILAILGIILTLSLLFLVRVFVLLLKQIHDEKRRK